MVPLLSYWNYVVFQVGVDTPGTYKIRLDSDSKEFGGFDRLDHSTSFFTSPDGFAGRRSSTKVSVQASFIWSRYEICRRKKNEISWGRHSSCLRIINTFPELLCRDHLYNSHTWPDIKRCTCPSYSDLFSWPLYWGFEMSAVTLHDHCKAIIKYNYYIVGLPACF